MLIVSVTLLENVSALPIALVGSVGQMAAVVSVRQVVLKEKPAAREGTASVFQSAKAENVDPMDVEGPANPDALVVKAVTRSREPASAVFRDVMVGRVRSETGR